MSTCGGGRRSDGEESGASCQRNNTQESRKIWEEEPSLAIGISTTQKERLRQAPKARAETEGGESLKHPGESGGNGKKQKER